jgi:uncharacterized protein
MINKVLTESIDILKQLCKQYRVKAMYAFGSVCSDKFNENSDIDFLITFDDISIEQYTDNYFDLHYNLEDLFNRRIDLLTENSLHNPYLIESIEQSKQLVYAA